MEKDFISNYMAIKNMTFEEMLAFIDYVYTTGLNDGMYAAGLDEDEKADIIGSCPYNSEWLSDEAEDATRHIFSDDGDEYLPNAFTKSILRVSGIVPDDIGNN